MRRLVLCCAACGAVSLLCGCASQTITERHYYEPTESTAFKREDGLSSGLERLEKHQSHQRRQVTGAMRNPKNHNRRNPQ